MRQKRREKKRMSSPIEHKSSPCTTCTLCILIRYIMARPTVTRCPPLSRRLAPNFILSHSSRQVGRSVGHECQPIMHVGHAVETFDRRRQKNLIYTDGKKHTHEKVAGRPLERNGNWASRVSATFSIVTLAIYFSRKIRLHSSARCGKPSWSRCKTRE